MMPDGLRSAAELALDKPHGTRMKYLGGCKCIPCRAANSRYETERAAARKAGDWNGVVDAARARKHLFLLSKQGIGRRAVQAASDVADTILQEIRSGKRQQIRQRTERKILAISADAASDRALIDARPTWQQIKTLLNEGFTKHELARRLGYSGRTIQLGRNLVTAKNAARIDRFYRQIMAGGEEAA